jgi:hypothetical protein
MRKYHPEMVIAIWQRLLEMLVNYQVKHAQQFPIHTTSNCRFSTGNGIEVAVWLADMTPSHTTSSGANEDLTYTISIMYADGVVVDADNLDLNSTSLSAMNLALALRADITSCTAHPNRFGFGTFVTNISHPTLRTPDNPYQMMEMDYAVIQLSISFTTRYTYDPQTNYIEGGDVSFGISHQISRQEGGQ